MPPVRLVYGSQFAHIDVITSVVIVVACFLIVYLTAHLARLSQHRGIRYFRLAFLFFGITYLVPLFRPAGRQAMHTYTPYLPLLSFIVVLAGTLAVLCLLYSVLYKRLPEQHWDPFLLIALIACTLTITTFLAGVQAILVLLQVVVFAASVVINTLDHREGRKKHTSITVLYTLLFVAWFANLAANFAFFLISINVAIALNLLSGALFVLILLRVIKTTLYK